LVERFALTGGRIAGKGYSQMALTGTRLVLLAVAGGLATAVIPCTSAAEPVVAGQDRIQFSERELPRNLAPSPQDPLARSGRFESLQRGGSMGGVVERLPGPSSGSVLQAPNARALELMEQRRNWIYATDPGAADFGSSAEQAMGVRSYDLTPGVSAPRGGLAGYMERERATPRREATTTNPLFDNRRDGLSFDSYQALDFTSGGVDRALVGRSSLDGHLQGRPGALGTGSLWLRSQSTTGGTAQNQSEQGSADRNQSLFGVESVRDMLRAPATSHPLASGFDPIDFRIDTTRQELNPTNPQRPFASPPNSQAVDLLGNINQGATDRDRSALAGILDRLAPDEQGASSLAPVVRAPADTRGAQPITRFGEFPSRRF
jgi:hypothetical protein